MEIEESYFRLLGKHIYNKNLDKYGHISGIEIKHFIGGYGIWFQAFYDVFDDNHILTFDDIEKGIVKFAIINLDYPTVEDDVWEELKEKEIEDIKNALGDKFREDMIIYIEEEARKRKNKENERSNFQKLHTDLVELDKISVEVLCDDFYSRELYLKYRRGVLTKEQLLYALINHLAHELNREEERNLEYFVKYEIGKELEMECDN